jgi:hypothetical protein
MSGRLKKESPQKPLPKKEVPHIACDYFLNESGKPAA